LFFKILPQWRILRGLGLINDAVAQRAEPGHGNLALVAEVQILRRRRDQSSYLIIAVFTVGHAVSTD
jgi:hypothetical protein